MLAALLVAGGVVRFATGGDGERPAAGGGDRPASSPAADGKADATDRTDSELVEAAGAGREQGEAKLRWVKSLGVDLPGQALTVFGPWQSGDVVAHAVRRTVSGYSAQDGRKVWSLKVSADICAAPTLPTGDGKIVIAFEEHTEDGADCSVLRMIDLRTGRAGWTKTLPAGGFREIRRDVAMSVNGDTVTYARAGRVLAYDVGDGKEVFGMPTGPCRPYAFTSGPRMIAATSCAPLGDDRADQRIQEVDPLTGEARWTYDVGAGWTVDQVYSTDPLVVSVQKGDAWKAVALRADGTLRAEIDLGTRDVDFGFADYEVRCGGYQMVTSNKDDCAGVAADSDTFYVSTKRQHAEFDIDNKLVAFDLDTGEQKWTVAAPLGRRVEPLGTEDGQVLVYVAPTKKQGGEIATAPAAGGDLRTVLAHPASTAAIEDGFAGGKIDYANGRSLVTRSVVGLEEDDNIEVTTKMFMAFGD
ncbi:PQQ-binding-like beta-propeller repeat protein [Streptomyces sp. HB132]|uniref:outer membrane protein assembly factor BamB family protein n=1 Tax=Streptomyces sp. HB132 TaxID=767388 RepID=UPI00196033E0|nr:PQQ-binding-like beta-propeller repeat protein [Streptomyces sp. HB132]MBM7441419.1 outer membrane protein assembly factor BamB [Streptomyces sp. HB132]